MTYKARMYDRDMENARLIVKDAPRYWLVQLMPLDGATRDKPKEAFARTPRVPSSMFGLGLANGAPGGQLIGGDVEWLTPLGQAVVDLLKQWDDPEA